MSLKFYEIGREKFRVKLYPENLAGGSDTNKQDVPQFSNLYAVINYPDGHVFGSITASPHMGYRFCMDVHNGGCMSSEDLRDIANFIDPLNETLKGLIRGL
jgi:hypothetical protein